MQAYLNDPALKSAFLVEIGKHEAADQLVKGTYGRMNSHFRGCAIGCSLHSLNVLQGKSDLLVATDQHARYESELGLPTCLAHLEDQLFERLPDDLSRTWPRRFAEAIPVGVVVTDRVLAQILRWGLADPTHGARYVTTDAEVVAIIDRMVALFDREIAGDSPSDTEWREAASAASATWAASAASATWDASAASATWDASAASAARAAAWATWDASATWDARAAWAASAASAARAAFYVALSEYLLGLLRALPVEPQIRRRV